MKPNYFTDKTLQGGFNNNLDSDLIIQSKSEKPSQKTYILLGIETIYINEKILKKMATIHAKLINLYEFFYLTVFSAKFDKQDEDAQM